MAFLTSPDRKGVSDAAVHSQLPLRKGLRRLGRLRRPFRWGEFLNDAIAPNVVDPGWPVFEPSSIVGEGGASTQLGGYAVVSVDNLEAALSIARRCPTVERGGGVEVAVLAALPAEHPAEQIRSRLATA
jgi:hypothetical protein